MTERFKQYLEAAFRKIKPTKAAMEYRKETLMKLEELAQDFRIKGMTDDEAIYKLCIDSLGDFDKTLADFDRALVEVPKKNSLKRTVSTAAVASAAVIVALYLVLSLTGAVSWGLSWLIFVGAATLAVIAVDVVLIMKAVKSDKFLVARLFNIGAVVMVFVFLYLVIELTAHPRYCWMTFLAMVIFALLVDMVIGFITKSKLTVPESFVWLILSSVLLYVMLGVANIMPWHPGWLLPALTSIAVAATALGIVINITKKNKSEMARKFKDAQTQVDEEYYTKW